jgi:hypothetical protein
MGDEMMKNPFRRKQKDVSWGDFRAAFHEIVEALVEFHLSTGMQPHDAAEKVEREVNHEFKYAWEKNGREWKDRIIVRYKGNGKFMVGVERHA